jgi:hypothetical protein
LDEKRRNAAALKIQTRVRTFLAQRWLARTLLAIKHNSAATTIQRFVRGHLCRQKFNLQKLVAEMKAEKERKRVEMEMLLMSRPTVGSFRILED